MSAQGPLARRAERYARPAATPAEDRAVACFAACGAVWALPLAQVLAVEGARPIHPLPLAPQGVLGVVRWRGQALAAHDAEFTLSGGALNAAPKSLLVLEPEPGLRFCLALAAPAWQGSWRGGSDTRRDGPRLIDARDLPRGAWHG